MGNVQAVALLKARRRPDGQPVLHQTWGKLLFLHWRVKPNLLRPHVPAQLEIDTYGESAWVGITSFTMSDVRAFPPYTLPVPGLSAMNEVNIRTYVHYEGVPGLWFFSLDSDNAAAVLAARSTFYLPYFTADIQLKERGKKISYKLFRDDDPAMKFHASWKVGKRLPRSQSGTREFFLTERYCLYTKDGDDIYRSRIHHEPWELYDAEVTTLNTNIFAANRLPVPRSQPIIHYAEEAEVETWFIEQVD